MWKGIAMEYIDYGIELRKKIESLEDGEMLILENKEYHISDDFLFERYGYITNHDHGLKNVAFLIENKKNITIDGNGANLIFHGRILPFWIVNSDHITVKNLSVNYIRPFFTEGEILSADYNQVTLRIDSKKYPFKLKEDRIIFYDEENRWENSYIKWFIEFDKELHAPVYGQSGSDVREQIVRATLVEEDVVLFKANFRFIHTVGNIINMTHEQRYNPCFFMHESKDVTIKDIHIIHSGAMGVIGQNSGNITIDNLLIQAKDTMVSCNNDATHFVNCDGKIKIINSKFMHQLDDGINTHGVYNLIERIEGNRLIVNNVHFQQVGNSVYREGDKIAIVSHFDECIVKECIVIESKTINKDFIELVVDDVDDIKVGQVAENITRMPKLYINNCHFADNRARAMLLSTNKKIVVENNYIHSSGTAIKIGGEIEKWYESGAVYDVTIRNNIFDNCGYALWGNALITDAAKLNEANKIHLYHNILIENNIIITFNNCILSFGVADGLTFRNNNIIESDKYDALDSDRERFELSGSKNIIIE